MIKVYTSSAVLDETRSTELGRMVIEESKDSTHVISFPECSYYHPTHPYELMRSFKSYVYKMMETNQDLWIVTYSTLVFDIIRLCAKKLNLDNAVELYDFKDNEFAFVTSIDDKGRMRNTASGIFDAEEKILLELV